MKVIVQRSLNSKVEVNNTIVGRIDKGLVILVGFTLNDSETDIDYMINKIINLRIFKDESGIMNKSVLEIKGSILSISQFTLYATLKGRRPSYDISLNYKEASKLYDLFNTKLSQYINVQKGVFGEDMQVSISNDGPVTIIIESGNKNDKKQT